MLGIGHPEKFLIQPEKLLPVFMDHVVREPTTSLFGALLPVLIDRAVEP